MSVRSLILWHRRDGYSFGRRYRVEGTEQLGDEVPMDGKSSGCDHLMFTVRWRGASNSTFHLQ